MAKLVKIAETKDLTPGQAAAFDVEGQKIALFNVEGTFYAVGDTCTHRGGPLSEGSVAGTTVTCPWHGADFDLKTGAVMRPPARKENLITALSAPWHSSGYASSSPAGRPTSLTMNPSISTPSQKEPLPLHRLDGSSQTLEGTDAKRWA